MAARRKKKRYLPEIAAGRLRLQSMAVTEPGAGSDTTRITTLARRDSDGYVVNGQKVFTSRLQHSDLLLLLARTSRAEDVARKTDGLSLFLVDMRTAGTSIEVRPIETMINHETNTLFINDLRLPADALIGQEGAGFRQVLDGLNAERILIASESIGDARCFIAKSVAYANQRVVFGRPIGANQGVQFPIARAYMHTEAASLIRWQAATLFERGQPCGAQANSAKLLASEAAWEAAEVAMTTHGGGGMAVETGIERKFREARLYLVAPITNNLVTAYVAEHVLGLPRSTREIP